MTSYERAKNMLNMKEKRSLSYDQIYDSVDLVNETYPNCSNISEFEGWFGKAFYWFKKPGKELILLGGFSDKPPEESKEICKISNDNEWVGKGYWQVLSPSSSNDHSEKGPKEDTERKDKLILLYLCSTDPSLQDGVSLNKDVGAFGEAYFLAGLHLNAINGELFELFYNAIFPNTF
jgi:hypothetical protein